MDLLLASPDLGRGIVFLIYETLMNIEHELTLYKSSGTMIPCSEALTQRRLQDFPAMNHKY